MFPHLQFIPSKMKHRNISNLFPYCCNEIDIVIYLWSSTNSFNWFQMMIMIGEVSPRALASAEWGGPIPPKVMIEYHLLQSGLILSKYALFPCLIQRIPASNLPDFTFPIFVLAIQISHGSLIVGLRRQDSLQQWIRMIFSIIHFLVQKVYMW